MRLILSLMVILMLAACAGEPTVQTGPGAETSFDGLVKVDHSRFREAWVNPDAWSEDAGRTTRVLIGEVVVVAAAVAVGVAASSGGDSGGGSGPTEPTDPPDPP